MVNVNAIKRKLDIQLNKFFKSQGYSLEEIESSNLYSVTHEHKSANQYTDFYVYAEMSVEEFFTYSENLNEVVESYDPSSYFDVVSPGIYSARIYWSAINEYKKKRGEVLTQKNLNKFGEAISVKLEDKYEEDFWVDDISYDKDSKLLSIEVSSDNYFAETSVEIFEEDLKVFNDLVDGYEGKIYLELENQIEGI